jgi:ubiquinone/menaquinone biosynthesis C-methylase UbiE
VFRRLMRVQFDNLAPRWDEMRSADPLASLDRALEHVESAPRRVLDLGTGTGLGAFLVARRFPEAEVVGVDLAPRMLAEARRKMPPELAGRVRFEEADAEQLPFPPASFDRVLLSLVLHQLADPTAAVREAFRVLRPGGLVLVRTIAPEDAVRRVPERYLPAMAAADAARLPPVDEVTSWLDEAGFADIAVERHLREKRLSLDDEERALRTEARYRYGFVTANDVEAAIRSMRADAGAVTGEWIDPRPTYVIVAAKPS